jgi:hypothetical protein
MNELAIKCVNRRELSAAKAGRALSNRLEYGLNVLRGLLDDTKDLARCRLLFDGRRHSRVPSLHVLFDFSTSSTNRDGLS